MDAIQFVILLLIMNSVNTYMCHRRIDAIKEELEK